MPSCEYVMAHLLPVTEWGRRVGRAGYHGAVNRDLKNPRNEPNFKLCGMCGPPIRLTI
jgi:hypothetical protein